ncbi:cytochrome c peroxidase [Dyadobacter sp. BE34]|uniref:Cytochrome c peroxidase n=1 Tax=Dyadobacter fermentans TaxID=94254 RepID=A0ABU1R0H6_9BACT|nr:MULTISPECIES: cytochrome c peroxidase [Dyadobacter]MDR6806394.1 cytochrome c peroxidase [Dyadobacter fermentans]MDR7044135.1 cytochrome c peroxidase [Dyadobacter sp. BE242]MDR7198446.1 cytochrome c peroxidase [Dyadobacter sp. BE34]MDR7216408.1 cytochrome c peroxidase [Dyadobacter sp. BE31]MDR7264065.1 cytochrome c peroxidase [Dyadobacter sp. BE32]
MWKALALCFALLLLAAAPERETIGVQNCTDHYRVDAIAFAASVKEMRIAIEKIDSTHTQSIEQAKEKLKNARLAYKRIAFFLDYFFFTSSRIYNRPPKNEIEEPHLEYGAPTGLQYIEALLFDNPGLYKQEMLRQCRFLETSAEDLPALLYNFEASDAQVLESVRLELVRVMTLSISGFDAPLLKSGINEALVSLQTIDGVLKPYIQSSQKHVLGDLLAGAEAALAKGDDFDHFDRLHFLIHHALPLQEHLGSMISGMELVINEKGVLNYNTKNIFRPGAFTQTALGGDKGDSALTDFGEKLFFETRLSSNGTRSCASCHNPALHFTDGLPRSIGIHPGQAVRRNAPSLLYSSFQHAQFWDGRARTLEEQIRTVIHDSLEMNGKPAEMIRKFARERQYRRLIRKVSPSRKALNDTIIYKAIAAYVRTLQPFNSDFDRYIAGDRTALTDHQVKGFNLFMGKAQCGTCHFAPLFNGLIPPTYTLTEFEILGTTASDDLLHPKTDPDQGRFETRPTPYYRGAFKTPTVRNAAVTAPYMHNGALGSLEKVVEFYDKGGGVGLGLAIPDQTLPATPLNLSEEEKSDLIAFLHSLTDRL